MTVDFVLVPNGGDHTNQRRHYADHMIPVWHALPAEVRGKFYCVVGLADYVRRLGVEPEVYESPREMQRQLRSEDGYPLTAVCGHSDPMWLDKTGRKNIILMHGTGFVFRPGGVVHTSYPGAKSARENTVLMLSTNEQIAEIERAANPHLRVEVVGCPKLDHWHSARDKIRSERPVIALAWHWRCKVAPEAYTAFDEYREMLPMLAEKYELLGHGHPRIIDDIEPIYQKLKIPVVRDLAEVFDRADLMVADATSAIFEFASLDRPVVFLRSRRYQSAGGMFGDLEHLGVVCRTAADVIPAIERSIGDPEPYRSARRAAVARAYAYMDGHCAERAARAILQQLEHENSREEATTNEGPTQ